METLITVQERAALYGLRPFIQMLYTFGIRPRMVVGTGLAKVTWAMLAQALYVKPARGLPPAKTGRPSIAKVRRAAAILIKAGLLINLSNNKQLVFKCPLAKYPKRKKTGNIKAPLLGAKGGIACKAARPNFKRVAQQTSRYQAHTPTVALLNYPTDD